MALTYPRDANLSTCVRRKWGPVSLLARMAIGRDLMSPEPSVGCTASGWVGRLRAVAGTVSGGSACPLPQGGSVGCAVAGTVVGGSACRPRFAGFGLGSFRGMAC